MRESLCVSEEWVLLVPSLFGGSVYFYFHRSAGDLRGV